MLRPQCRTQEEEALPAGCEEALPASSAEALPASSEEALPARVGRDPAWRLVKCVTSRIQRSHNATDANVT